MNTSERFWSKVREEGSCWVWQAGKFDTGYGMFYREGRTMQAHRAAYQEMVGEIPQGLVLDHLCRNRACVNPYHLDPVTVRVNNLRGESAPARNACKTHCVRGHPFTRHDGVQRVCNECRHMKQRERRRGDIR